MPMGASLPTAPSVGIPDGVVAFGRVPMSPVRLTPGYDSGPSTIWANVQRAPSRGCERALSVCRVRSRQRSAGQPALQHHLPLLGALAAVGLGLAEEVGELVVTRPLGVLDVELQAHGVAQAGLGVPDEVVVLVGRARDVAGLAGHAAHTAAPLGDLTEPLAGAATTGPRSDATPDAHQCSASPGHEQA